jgi:RNA-directed DNA polymerase
MLATLETGIEGGKWFRLIDKVWSSKNLAGSLRKVVAKGGSAGIDNQSARAVYEHQEQTIQKMEQELRAGQYQPVDFSEFMKAVKQLGVFWAAVNERGCQKICV